MGFLEWLRGDKYAVHAQMEFNQMKANLGVTNKDRKKEAMGAALVIRIREMYRQGGEMNHRYAVALWQIGNALYPEYVTEKDYPQFVPKRWEGPVPDL